MRTKLPMLLTFFYLYFVTKNNTIIQSYLNRIDSFRPHSAQIIRTRGPKGSKRPSYKNKPKCFSVQLSIIYSYFPGTSSKYRLVFEWGLNSCLIKVSCQYKPLCYLEVVKMFVLLGGCCVWCVHIF